MAGRLRADEQAKRIPWERLLQSRVEYIEWSAFAFWVRSIIDAERDVPPWVANILQVRCPGLLNSTTQHSLRQPDFGRMMWLRLSAWIKRTICASAREGGWLEAITYYALRDPAYLHAWAYWKQCRVEWRKTRPESYPAFEEWFRKSKQCEFLFLLRPQARERWAPYRGVSAARLEEAVTRYVDWEAFAYWSRCALEAHGDPPTGVMDELQRRCPGFVEHDRVCRLRDRSDEPRSWIRLMQWGTEHFFSEAKSEGWFDLLLQLARDHPRAQRTIDYWLHWSESCGETAPVLYPSFREWRQAADRYVADENEGEERAS